MARPVHRRARLLAFIAPWSEARAEYRGSFGFGALDLAWLTTLALEEIAASIVSDWQRRRRARARLPSVASPPDRAGRPPSSILKESR